MKKCVCVCVCVCFVFLLFKKRVRKMKETGNPEVPL